MSLVLFDLFNTQLSWERYWPTPRSQAEGWVEGRVAEGVGGWRVGTIPNGGQRCEPL